MEDLTTGNLQAALDELSACCSAARCGSQDKGYHPMDNDTAKALIDAMRELAASHNRLAVTIERQTQPAAIQSEPSFTRSYNGPVTTELGKTKEDWPLITRRGGRLP